ncbi:hypothetical protein AAVH_42148, partial [Aphelenchoides avenae]
ILFPNETLLIVLRWLHRFDLDSVQITNKRLRSLVENNEMPLRFLESVKYIGDAAAEGTKNVLLLEPKGQQKDQCPLGMSLSFPSIVINSNFIEWLNLL